MDHSPGATHEALPLDPEHDIDAKSATRWFVGGTIVLFLSLWLMVPIFVRVLEFEQQKKINDATPTELDGTGEREAQVPRGATPNSKSIEDVIGGLRDN